MAHTNRGRVILGGLLAGVFINVFQFITDGVVLKEAWAEVMQSLGKSPATGTKAIVLFNIEGFLLGIAAVWVYAAIRPRYGAGVRTALRAGAAVWFMAAVLPDIVSAALGIIPGWILLTTGAVGLVEIVIATVIGAWPYKEGMAEAPAARGATA